MNDNKIDRLPLTYLSADKGPTSPSQETFDNTVKGANERLVMVLLGAHADQLTKTMTIHYLQAHILRTTKKAIPINNILAVIRRLNSNGLVYIHKHRTPTFNLTEKGQKLYESMVEDFNLINALSNESV